MKRHVSWRKNIAIEITKKKKGTNTLMLGIPEIPEADVRMVLDALNSKFGLMQHQLESYNQFIERTMTQIIHENSVLVIHMPQLSQEHGAPVRMELSFKNVKIQPPSIQDESGFVSHISPHAARDRNSTYASSVFVDIEQKILKMPDTASTSVSALTNSKSNSIPNSQHQTETTPDTRAELLGNIKRYTRRLLCNMPVMVGSEPCFLKQTGIMTGECPHDEGGYFVINGMEKIMVSQEKLRTNFPYIFSVKKSSTSTSSSSTSHHPKNMELVCEVRSCHESKLRSSSTLKLFLSTSSEGGVPSLSAALPYIECPIRFDELLVLLGWNAGDVTPSSGGELEHMLLNNLCGKQHIPGSPEAALSFLVRAFVQDQATTVRQLDRDAVIRSIGQRGTHERDPTKQYRYVEYICCKETLPHMGMGDSAEILLAKRAYLCFMVSKLFSVLLGLTEYDDRDHFANKRVDTSGPLMAHLFRQLYRSFLKSLQSQVQKLATAGRFVDLMDSRLISHKRITGGLERAFSTGNWGTPKIAGGAGSATGQVGITQQLSQMTGMSATAHGRRLNTPLHKEGRNPRPRQLSNSAWGIVCPTETPEGISCGIVKNLAWGARVRTGTLGNLILPCLMQLTEADKPLIVPLSDCLRLSRAQGSWVGTTMVTLNGTIVGYCRSELDAERVRHLLRRHRRQQGIPFDTTVAHIRRCWQSELRIHSDPGCLVRPVWCLENLRRLPSLLASYRGARYAYSELWGQLLSRGIIEYIDKDEESTLRVGDSLRACGGDESDVAARQGCPYTHAEIHPSVVHGVCASLIPFSNHNQSPRNTYQSAMGKQALGVPLTNYKRRMDATMNILVSPERPLVATWMEDFTSSKALPSGQNVMVAIMCYTGFNQEDSLIMCRSSVEAGMFHSLSYRTCRDETRPNGTDLEKIEVPDPEVCTRMKAADYSKLDPSTGVARVGEVLEPGDIIIGKTVMTTDSNATAGGKVRVVRDKSCQVRASEEGRVDQVSMSSNHEGQKSVKVRLRQLRVPEIGDKFSSRHGQKGVVGAMLHRQDMPYTEDGMVPDIIVNPHAIPSRMTIGHLFETLLGAEAVHSAELGDGTPFRDLSIEQVARRLEAKGFDRYCQTKMRCGFTGKELAATVFYGPTYYQRLKHMVHDKVHARSRGPVVPLTRQPVEGRSREGGLRIGEMERDAFVSHGAAANVRESLFERSDPHVTNVCMKCGLLCDAYDPIKEKATSFCHLCGTGEHASEKPMPYACKLTLREITALHITPRFVAQEDRASEGSPREDATKEYESVRPVHQSVTLYEP